MSESGEKGLKRLQTEKLAQRVARYQEDVARAELKAIAVGLLTFCAGLAMGLLIGLTIGGLI